MLLAIIVSWALSAILTIAGVAESDKARTDHRIDVLKNSDWFRVPYPGMNGFVFPIFFYFFYTQRALCNKFCSY